MGIFIIFHYTYTEFTFVKLEHISIKDRQCSEFFKKFVHIFQTKYNFFVAKIDEKLSVIAYFTLSCI